ncbi:MAG: hypothetical protein KGI08_09505 [Thaumarchaeota archaeon]|nr:hypothetical protein [Nitrososphaerota archaeon]
MKDAVNDTAPAVAVGISLTHSFPQVPNSTEQKQMVMQTHVPIAASDKELNAVLDRLMRASNRQSAIVNLPIKEKLLKNNQKILKRMTEDVFRLDSEAEIEVNRWKTQYEKLDRRKEWSINELTSLQRTTYEKRKSDRSQALTLVERCNEEIDALSNEIDALKKIISGE